MVIHIFFRHAPIGRLVPQSRPSWFSYRNLFTNLMATIGSSLAAGTVRLHVLFDGLSSDFEQDDIYLLASEAQSSKQYPTDAIRSVLIKGGDQRRAWRACLTEIDKLGSLPDNDIIYFLENDYAHIPDWVNKIQELEASGIAWDYLSLYDHLDKYPGLCSHPDSKRYRDLKSHIFCSGTHHWRSTPGTCASYLTHVRTYRQDRQILNLGLYDFRLFKLLTRVRRRVLLSPIPSLSTHSMEQFAAPVVDWSKIVTGQA